ncbi:MAG: diacylglycerol kinase family lipid kinase [Oscillospiraceae bacterium]|nr:diacylglycerol kinase family lipid kinase [Oscillospiraceae bacterium]
MKSLLLVINPAAGKGSFRNGLDDVLLTFHKAGFQPTVAFTDQHGDATDITAREGAGYDRVVCVGGDGTLGETVTGLMQLPAEKRPTLGYIPMGTTNDFAHTLGLSHDPVQAAYVAAYGNPLAVDAGHFNNRGYFTYVAAFGAFTEVTYETPQEQKNNMGFFAYVLDGMRRLPNLTHRWTRVEYDGGILEDDFLFGAVSNSRSIAGIIKLKESVDISLNDGMFEVILIRTPESLLQLGPILTNILTSSFTSEDIIILHTQSVRFTFRDPVAWTLDGEDGGSHSVVQCQNTRHALQFIVDPARVGKETIPMLGQK